ncbi:MAG: right-handed parallel beta-helix repeat-containing protein, partial [Thermoplasmata archaeon]|nr:right-handed parallel beta-helix repeat-containing protein [Thermoplasmata archaeon]
DSHVLSHTEKHYTFKVLGGEGKDGVLAVEESTISGCGYHSTIPGNTGIYCASGSVIFSGAAISNNHIGIRYHGVDDDIEILNSTFLQNHKALVLESSSGISIQGNLFLNNAQGLSISRCSDVELKDNTMEGNLDGIRIDNSTGCRIEGNILKSNLRSGINVDYSSCISITGNRIEYTRSGVENCLATGIKLRNISGCEVCGNTLLHNDIGVMMLSNNSGVKVDDLTIQGGVLGFYLYNQYLSGEFEGIRIFDTIEAGLSARYCTKQVIHNFTSGPHDGLVLNITASEIEFVSPEFTEMNNLVDEKSTVRLLRTIRVHTLELSGVPIPFCDVRVAVGEHVIYASRGYGGNDPVTNSRGYTGPILTEY